MAPSLAVLFHNKRSIKKEPSESKPARRPRPAGPVTQVKAEPEEDVKPALPDGPYQEFKLMSCNRSGWKYDVMKFDSRRTVDIGTWQKPVKLNRKEMRRDAPATDIVPEAVAPMLGPDGKPVIGADGRMVMVDADGRPIHAQNGTGGLSAAAAAQKAKEDKAAKKKKFQKKTKQVYPVAEEIRQLRKEERYPWVMEDASQKEMWVGMMEEVSKSTTHALFMPSNGNVFKFVPAHRWYKFQKKPAHIIPTLEEAEKLMAQRQKNKDPERWLLHKRNGQAPSAATVAIFKAEAEGRTVTSSNSLVHSSSQSLGPGGRRLKTVDSGMRGLFEEDDEEGVDIKRKREKEYGGEGDMDEMEYEEDFADDEEKMEPEGADDEEAKELEERLKREYKNANKTREGYIDEDDDEEEEEQLTGAGKAMKKLVRKIDKNAGYDSDEDKNPYASSAEEEEEEEPQPPPVSQPSTEPSQSETQEPPSRSQTPAASSRPTNKSLQQHRDLSSKPSSRAASPAPSPAPSQTLGGHSVVAKRATSPKAPKLKTSGGGASRATSPLAPSRAGSPPAPTTPTSARMASPTGATPAPGSGLPPKPSTKRKATDDPPAASTPGAPYPAPGMQPKLKKRKAQPSAGAAPTAPPGELKDEMVIEWLRNTPNATTRDCIQYFQPCLTDEAKKARFTALVKEVAILKQGVLVLRGSYREGSAAAASPGS